MTKTKNIEELIKKLRYDTSSQMYGRIFDNVLQAQEQAEQQKPAVTRPNIWRIIIKSKKRRLAIAAITLIAIGIGLVALNSSSDRTEQYILKEMEEYAEAEPDVIEVHTSVDNTKGFSSLTLVCDDLDDSNCGIPVDRLSRDEACYEILAQFWHAIIVGDLTRIRQLLPIAADWDNEVLKDNLGLSDKNQLVELLEIGQPYERDAFDNRLVLVPNLFRYQRAPCP